jgi:nitrogen fixation/metabolism regulation signal transduction histidine kinase
VKQKLRRRFRLMTVLQVLLLGVSLSALILTLLMTEHIAVPAVIAMAVVLQVIGLIQHVQSHVDALEDFFAAVNYEDFTRRFVEDDIDAELKDAFNQILSRFQDARAARDLQAGYLDTVIRHVPVPFIAADPDGTVSLVNHPARRLTGLSVIRNLDDLAALDPELPVLLHRIDAGQQRLLQTNIRGLPVELRVSVAEIRMEARTERLYSIENLSGELSARESSAWRNLIRVLTHEIMNTLTPVTSLADTTVSMLDDPRAIDDIRLAITTIGRRSSGLIEFVSKYRELLQVPNPHPQSLSVRELFDATVALLAEPLAAIDVVVDIVPESLTLEADRQLLDQVVLNLVKNAIEALQATASPRIRLEGRLDLGRTILSVNDNGPGVPEDVRDQVFIPFFTTKRTGSGIGLSLSRQIMTAHNGDIAVHSGADGTTVSLVFG